jgi:hypothetical protein
MGREPRVALPESPWARASGPRSRAAGEGAQRVSRFVTRRATIDEETMGVRRGYISRIGAPCGRYGQLLDHFRAKDAEVTTSERSDFERSSR